MILFLIIKIALVFLAVAAILHLKKQRDNLLQLLRDLYRDANPTFFEDADKGVRLSPRWNERIKEILER